MIIYREDDVQPAANSTEDEFGWCGCAHPDGERHLHKKDGTSPGTDSSRAKRSLFGLFGSGKRSVKHLKNLRCPVVLVADYGFFSTMGGSSIEYAANYLVSVLKINVFLYFYLYSRLSDQYWYYYFFTSSTKLKYWEKNWNIESSSLLSFRPDVAPLAGAWHYPTTFIKFYNSIHSI